MSKLVTNRRLPGPVLWTLALACLVGCLMTGRAAASPQSGSQASATAQGGKYKATQAAWEYRPYEVVVWVAHNDGWRLRSIQNRMLQGISQLAVLTDSSAWKVRVQRAPNPWNWRLLGDFNRKLFSDDLQLAAMSMDPDASPDKLIVVTINDERGMFDTTVQEMDLRTKIWGPLVKRRTELANLEPTIFESIKTAFMPVTRIETVRDRDVRVRVRASGIATIVERDDEGNLQLVPNTGSPAWIGEDEILLPVILRNDRRGNLESITPVQWTFLSILERDGPHLACTTHAMRRTPLGGRIGGRVERIGLSVRAPSKPTRLRLVSSDGEQRPLADLEIISRGPGTAEGEASEVLGKTDWRGEILIPPNDEGIRILGVFSGQRPLARVPMVPGLFDEQETTMPNDESRLYAEGIVRGLQNELMDNLARRQVLSAQVEMAIEKGDVERAEELLREMSKVPDSSKFNPHLITERQRLLSREDKRLANDDRQRGYIMAMFEELMLASSKFLDNSTEAALNRQVRDARTSGSPSSQ